MADASNEMEEDARDTDAGNRNIVDSERSVTNVSNNEVNPDEGSSASGFSTSKKKRRRRKQKSLLNKCLTEKWTCDGVPLWRIYMNLFAEDERELEKTDRFNRRKPANLTTFPRVKSDEDLSSPEKCFPLSIFQQKNQTVLPSRLNRDKMFRIWKNMRVHPSKSENLSGPRVSQTETGKSPGVWPCTTRDLVNELKERYGKRNKRRKDIFPCDRPIDDDADFGEPKDDFAHCKELGHARIPPVCPPIQKDFLVDRDAGEQPGLVDGDYTISELFSKVKGNRVYANVCLRGLKGMHLAELSALRTRRKTWKFCFYQAIVGLLAKTQLRYKYAWSVNIDYIYDHAWMLFTHIGEINVKEKQRLDDIVVYNYKYSIELQLVQESNNVPIVKDIPQDYEERNCKRKTTMQRRELTNVIVEIGSEKMIDQQNAVVHKNLLMIENWFDRLPIRYRNCIFRTTRYSLAFWKDGSFWYLYNPYRCDEFGYWNDDGYACIMKFCTKQSLKRHLMILLLRAYVYTNPIYEATTPQDNISLNENQESNDLKKSQSEERKDPFEEEFYNIQIFNMIYHCCQIHNLKLLQRGPPKPAYKLVKKKSISDCPFDPLDCRDLCAIEREEDLDVRESIEKPSWLKLFKITWTKCVPSTVQKKTINKEVTSPVKLRWHQYLVEESNKLFSLFGEIHITNGMFEKENRGMQTYACYVVCAGMTRIMAPEYWSPKTLDVIVMCGDRFYTLSKLERELKSTKNEYKQVGCWKRYLSSHFKIGETIFEANVLPGICGMLYVKTAKYLWQSLEQMFLKYQFGILTCENACLGVFKFCGAYYMCDVGSFGPPVFPYGEGAAYLVRATYFYKFMTVLILTIGSPECSRFTLNPIEILKAIEVGPVSFPGGKLESVDRVKKVGKKNCPYDEEKKKLMKRWKHKKAEATRTIDKLCCKENE